MIYHLSFVKSFDKINREVKDYNSKLVDIDGSKLLARMIRPAHVLLLRELVRLYGRKIKEAKLHVSQSLPGYFTNRRILAEQINCSEKTIYNLLARLEEAGFISKVFRGANFSFEILFTDRSVVFDHEYTLEEMRLLQQKAAVNEVKAEVLAMVQSTAPDALISPGEMQSLPHIIETRNFNKNLLITKGAFVERNPTNESIDSYKTPIDKKQREQVAEKNQELQPVQRKNIPGPAAGVPIAMLSVIYGYSVELWQYCIARIYAGRVRYLAPAQIIHAQTYFMARMLRAKDAKSEFTDLKLRLSLVDNYVNAVIKPVNKGEKPQKARYIPLPTAYFIDHKPDGFAITAQWLEKIVEGGRKYEEIKKRAEAELRIFGAFRKAINPVVMNQYTDLNQYMKTAHQVRSLTPSGKLADALNELIVNQEVN